MKVLVIDDNNDIIRLLEVVAKSEGHEITQVDNGLDGINLMKNNEFDAVFLDISMPKFSGIDVINTLDKDGILKKQPIILFTASSLSTKEMQEMTSKGIHSYLQKPTHINQIIDTLNQIKKN